MLSLQMLSFLQIDKSKICNIPRILYLIGLKTGFLCNICIPVNDKTTILLQYEDEFKDVYEQKRKWENQLLKHIYDIKCYQNYICI